MPRASKCPECGSEYDTNVVICVRCGIDLRTGRALQMDSDPPAGETSSGEKRHCLAMRALVFVGNLLPGMFRPGILVVSTLMVAAALVVFYFSMVFLLLGGVFTAVAMAAGGLILYGQAIAWMLTGGFGLLHEALADLDGSQWLMFFVLLLLPLVAVIGLVLPAME